MWRTLALSSLLFSAAAFAQEKAPFFAGKTMRVNDIGLTYVLDVGGTYKGYPTGKNADGSQITDVMTGRWKQFGSAVCLYDSSIAMLPNLGGMCYRVPSFTLNKTLIGQQYSETAPKYVQRTSLTLTATNGSGDPRSSRSPSGHGAAAVLPDGPLSFVGNTSYRGRSTPVRLDLTVSSEKIRGSESIEFQGRRYTVPVAGTIQDGQCHIVVKDDAFIGPCDRQQFNGRFVDEKSGAITGTFALVAATAPAIGLQRTQAVPSAVRNPPILTRPIAVWALGRARVLAERGSCGAATTLKGYCFKDGAEWLASHPGKTSLDVIAMQDRWAPGSYVPYNSGQGWDVYRLSRAGESYRADQQRHFGTQVRVPTGCNYRGELQQAWLISVARGRKVAVEATQFSCDGWNGRQLASLRSTLEGEPFDVGSEGYDARQNGRSMSPSIVQNEPANQSNDDFSNPGFKVDLSDDFYGNPGVAAGAKKPPRRRK